MARRPSVPRRHLVGQSFQAAAGFQPALLVPRGFCLPETFPPGTVPRSSGRLPWFLPPETITKDRSPLVSTLGRVLQRPAVDHSFSPSSSVGTNSAAIEAHTEPTAGSMAISAMDRRKSSARLRATKSCNEIRTRRLKLPFSSGGAADNASSTNWRGTATLRRTILVFCFGILGPTRSSSTSRPEFPLHI